MIKEILNAAIDYIKDDQSKKFGLKERVTFTIAGDNVGGLNFTSEYLKIASTDANSCEITIEPFAPETELWNGADILPENLNDGSFEASLVHDLIWGYSEEIAKANNISEQAVLKWSNGVMGALMKRYEQKPRKFWRRVVYSTLEICRHFYKPVKKWLGKLLLFLVLVLCLIGFTGCFTPPNWHVVSAQGEILSYQSEEGSANK